MSELQSLGMATGRSFHTTTFRDSGLLNPDDPFREAWSYIEPTFMSQIAALLQLLRDPYFVRAVQERLDSKYTIASYARNWISMQLAIIFGDSATATHTRDLVASERHALVKRASHPGWFRAAANGKDFRLNQPKIAVAHTLTSITTAARAHELTGYLGSRQTADYFKSGVSTIGWAHNVSSLLTEPPTTLSDLHKLGEKPAGYMPMTSSLLEESGALKLLADLLDSNIQNDLPFRDRTHVIGGLMRPEDRTELQFRWTDDDKARFEEWCATYYSRATTDRFEVSLRGA